MKTSIFKQIKKVLSELKMVLVYKLKIMKYKKY